MLQLKKFITGMLVRWILKIGGAWLVTIGVGSDTIEEIVFGIVSIVLGIIISLFQQKKAIETPTP